MSTPNHYQGKDGMQCLDAMEACMSAVEIRGFMRGNIFKYLWRYEEKAGVQDLRKAADYLEMLIELEESMGDRANG